MFKGYLSSVRGSEHPLVFAWWYGFDKNPQSAERGITIRGVSGYSAAYHTSAHRSSMKLSGIFIWTVLGRYAKVEMK